jgi:hypothetical protein
MTTCNPTARHLAGCLALFSFAWSLQSLGINAHGADKLQFNRDVRPILFDACIACHGPDSAARQAELRLDRREAAIDHGALVPGDPEASELIRRILSTDEAEQMPPPETKKVLTAEQKEILTRWVKEGAEYEPHWSLIRPTRSELPSVKDATWPRNAIDHFIGSKLDEVGLAPAPVADRRTLARRVSLDLTGLPPKSEAVDAFVNDTDANAYEKYVDALLASSAWGEHRGRYWLDVARYADTHGIHFDNYREMWAYRDWVINAFNANMPFDQFTLENLAGDLLPEATLDQQIGSGFNRCNITTNEGGAIDEEYLVLYARDRTETTSVAWLGLTSGCAVCHDHKFDPLTQREFYELSAFFNNTTQAAMDGNVKDTAPVVVVPREEDRDRWDEIKVLRDHWNGQLTARREQARGEFDAWHVSSGVIDISDDDPRDDLQLGVPLDQAGDTMAYEFKGEPLTAPKNDKLEWQEGIDGKQAALLNGQAIFEHKEVGDFENNQKFSYAVWVKLPANDSRGAIFARMDDRKNYRGWDLWVENRRIGSHLVNNWPGNAIKVLTKEQLPANEWVHVAVNYDGSMKAAGLQVYVNGLKQPTDVLADTLKKTLRTEVPFKIGQRHKESPISGVAISDIRVYDRLLTQMEITTLGNRALFKILAKPAGERTGDELTALYDWWLPARDTRYSSVVKKLVKLERDENDIKARGTVAHVMSERSEPGKAYVLNRGEYDQRLDEVQPDTPEMLPQFPSHLPRNRLGFAKWLLQDDQPLTSRVVVNRFWQEVFGTGLVSSAGDFGVSGQLPSHPELLDWLAVEFRENGWDVKQLFKLMVMSAAYQQSAVTTPEKLERDPDNRLLSRGPRYRLDAEMVRDYALAACGVLSDKIGGPSVKPYQPPGVWEAVAMIGSNTRDYKADEGDALYRRSMYTFWKRSAPPASMDIFNAPSREGCTMARERTNTPLQALVTLNDPQYIEAARKLAESVLKLEAQDFDDRLQWVVGRLLARNFNETETDITRRSFDELLKFYQSHTEQAEELVKVGELPTDNKLPVAELAAWTMMVNQLLNLDETLNK